LLTSKICWYLQSTTWGTLEQTKAESFLGWELKLQIVLKCENSCKTACTIITSRIVRQYGVRKITRWHQVCYLCGFGSQGLETGMLDNCFSSHTLIFLPSFLESKIKFYGQFG
jgi:hypothetical protein